MLKGPQYVCALNGPPVIELSSCHRLLRLGRCRLLSENSEEAARVILAQSASYAARAGIFAFRSRGNGSDVTCAIFDSAASLVLLPPAEKFKCLYIISQESADKRLRLSSAGQWVSTTGQSSREEVAPTVTPRSISHDI
eukprot:6475598-Amphidinium_carterae.2